MGSSKEEQDVAVEIMDMVISERPENTVDGELSAGEPSAGEFSAGELQAELKSGLGKAAIVA